MFLILAFRVFGTFTVLAFAHSCGPSEYRSAGGECCPMCNIGSRVFWHCTEDTSTTCIPCPVLTYTDEPNRLISCLPCTVCDANQGLRLNKACTRSADTVCEPREGFYCTVKNKGSCTLASEHSKCNPGQYIKQTGTKRSDTVCVNCGHGFYSPSGLNCTKWTDCATRNEIQTADGSFIKDVTCTQKRGRYGLIAAVLAAVPSVLSLFRYRSSEMYTLKVLHLNFLLKKQDLHHTEET